MISNKLEDNIIRIDDRRKVSLRFKAIRIIDFIVENMYCEPVLILMQKQGYSIEPEDIKEGKALTKKKLMSRHVDGKATKELSGVISTLKNMEIELRKNNRALTAQMPEGIKND